MGFPVAVITAASTGMSASISFSLTATEEIAEAIEVERGDITDITHIRAPTIPTVFLILISSGAKHSKIAMIITTAISLTADLVGASILPVISFFVRLQTFCGVTLNIESKSAESAPISLRNS